MRKEIKLSSSPVSFLFILFGFMFFIPGYPILCGGFFVTLGIFQSFQFARESNDIVFSALLPIAKKDVVKGKYLFVVFIEGCAFIAMAISVTVRMTVLSGSSVYINNALMNANMFALGAALFIFGIFNCIFVGGFFKTAYRIGRPFVCYIIVSFIVIGIAETLHHIPGLGAVNAFGSEHLGFQLAALIAGFLLFFMMTVISYRTSCRNFDKIDL